MEMEPRPPSNPRAVVALRLLSLLVRMWLFLAVAMLVATPFVVGAIFFLEWMGAPGWSIFVTMIVLVIGALIVCQPAANRLVNDHRFRCAGCGEAAARFRWVGGARKNQPHEFRCESCGRSDINTVIGTVISLVSQR